LLGSAKEVITWSNSRWKKMGRLTIMVERKNERDDPLLIGYR
jgi:hypothetical protein